MKSPQDFPSCHLPLRTVLKLAIFPLLVLFLVSSATLDAQAPKKVPFPFSPIGINSLPWFVAKETRIPEKHGIDFNPVFIGSSAVLFQSMLSGAADFAGSGGPAVIANVLRGGDIIQITAMVPRFTQSVMVKPEIKKPEDMAGKKIGVSRLGTATHFALQTAIDGHGVKGVTILQLGGQPEALVGLVRGSVDGAVFSPPYNFQLKKQGYNELVSPKDLQKLTEFVSNGIVGRRSVAEKDKRHRYPRDQTHGGIDQADPNRSRVYQESDHEVDAHEGPGYVGAGLSFRDGELFKRGLRARERAALYDQTNGAGQSRRGASVSRDAGDRLLRQPLRRGGEAFGVLRPVVEIADGKTMKAER